MNHSAIARILLPSVLILFVSVVIVAAVRINNAVYIPDIGQTSTQASIEAPVTPVLPTPEIVPYASSTVPMSWNLYTDKLLGYSYAYPGTLVPKYTRYGNCFAERILEDFCVEARAVADERSLDDLFNAKTPNWVIDNYAGMEKEKTTILGRDAYRLHSPTKQSEYGYPKDALLVRSEHYVLDIWGNQIPEGVFSSVAFTAPSIDLSPYTLDIAWSAEANSEVETPQEATGRFCTESNGYVVGEVQNGTFKGDRIVARIASECEMDCGGRGEDELAYYIYHGDRVVPAGRENGYTVPVTPAPVEIPIPNSSYVLKRDFASGILDKKKIKSTLFTSAVAGNVYETSYYRSCIVTERQDHALVYYSLQIPFINKENGVVDLTLSNGKKFNESYDVDSDWSCLPVVDMPNGLHEVARNSLGEPFFALSAVDPKLREIYENKNTIAAYQKLGLTYDEYLDINPLLYWKDPFGRWIEMKNKKYIQAAEKCKPVIYLYPEKQMDVSVYVAPNGGFTHTIPEYGDGWHVTAFPDGTIIDKATSETYPYLYWAGWGLDTPAITKGWVVARDDTSQFLSDKLTKLGLNAKEIADFNEYWVAKLAEDNAPYHKIMFLDQEEFNLMAPLRVVGEKRPDHIIRVVMYAQATARKEALPVQVLPETPSREGFTVVEWGGSLLK